MCRLLGITNFNYPEHRGIVENFLALARTGKTLPEDPPGHADGWGIGFYRDGAALVHRSGGSAAEEKEEFLRIAREIGRSPVAIFHLRKSAWPQTTAAEHSHPFTYRNMLFAHNGTVRDYRLLRERIPAHDRPGPDALDTEVLFRYIAGLPPASAAEKYALAIETVRRERVFSALNSVFTDGKALCAARVCAKHPEYYTLFAAHEGGIVSSEPLSPCLSWRALGNGELVTL